MNIRKFIWRKSICLILLLLVMFLVSCSAQGTHQGSGNPEDQFPNESIDGVNFKYYKDVVYNNQIIEIYEPRSIELVDGYANSQSIQYIYQKLEKETPLSWRINYFYQYKVLSNYIDKNELSPEYAPTENEHKEELNFLASEVSDSLSFFEKSLGLDFVEYDYNEKTLCEFNIDNKEENEPYLIIMYVPYCIVNKTTNKTYNILIPVKTFLAYEINDFVTFNYGEVSITISYDSFATLKNISNIEERGYKYV